MRLSVYSADGRAIPWKQLATDCVYARAMSVNNKDFDPKVAVVCIHIAILISLIDPLKTTISRTFLISLLIFANFRLEFKLFLPRT